MDPSIVATLPGPTIAMHVVGSTLYGLAMPESDLDLAYVFVQPTRTMLGLYPPGERALTCEGRIEGPRRVEYVAHEVGKFGRLLLQGNPTMVERLWAPTLAAAPEWLALRERRRLFVSQAAVRQYLGYLTGQMRRMQRGAPVHTTGGRLNGKWAAHLLRLAWDLRAVVDEGEPVVQWATRPEALAHLREVRAGDAPLWDAAVEQVRGTVAVVNAAAPWGHLPEVGFKDWLEGWLLLVRQQYGGDSVSSTPTCWQGSPTCYCRVGWSYEKQCPACRDTWSAGEFRGSYCVCPPPAAPIPGDTEKGLDTTASPA